MLALVLGIAAGVLEIRLTDLLITALFVMICTMVLGYLRPRAAWRWTVLVGVCVPLVRAYAYYFLHEQASRAQIWESGLGMLTGVAGAYCGAFSHKVIHELFHSNREPNG